MIRGTTIGPPLRGATSCAPLMGRVRCSLELLERSEGRRLSGLFRERSSQLWLGLQAIQAKPCSRSRRQAGTASSVELEAMAGLGGGGPHPPTRRGGNLWLEQLGQQGSLAAQPDHPPLVSRGLTHA